ncbi:hypothetical protein [Parvibaculum sp.]|nr:hypothetical protein [Parvibaculum sp.]|tara:strand:- start:251 stop:379 length:129 start_codon:yes stop_codon:yes gene_type:complete
MQGENPAEVTDEEMFFSARQARQPKSEPATVMRKMKNPSVAE